MNVARIKDGIVINIEVADQSWVDANQGVDGCTFVPYTPDDPAALGRAYSDEDGFQRPEQAEATVTVTVDKAAFDALDLTVKQRATLTVEDA